MRRGHKRTMRLGLAVLLIFLAGCSSDSDKEADSIGDSQVEVFSWWTGAGLEEGLNALANDFKAKNPGIEFVNAAVAGSAGSSAKTILRDRLKQGNPPDAYQVHAGLELASDVEANYVEDLTPLFDENGWKSKLPQGLVERLEINGKIYAVPVDIHRANMMWFNPKTLTAAGLSGPAGTWEEFLSQAAVLSAKGIQPLVVGPASSHKHLLECVLLGVLGADAYMGLWDGTTDWQATPVQSALSMYTKVIAYSNIKSAFGEWAAAADAVIAGSAGYMVLGDWVNAYMAVTKGLTYQVDYNATTSPGTAGIFSLVSDAFAMPKNAPHPSAAEKWLIECGSVEGQDIFNPLKGSIPARIDIDKTKYKGYSATSMEAWQDPQYRHRRLADSWRRGQ